MSIDAIRLYKYLYLLYRYLNSTLSFNDNTHGRCRSTTISTWFTRNYLPILIELFPKLNQTQPLLEQRNHNTTSTVQTNCAQLHQCEVIVQFFYNLPAALWSGHSSVSAVTTKKESVSGGNICCCCCIHSSACVCALLVRVCVCAHEPWMQQANKKKVIKKTIPAAE